MVGIAGPPHRAIHVRDSLLRSSRAWQPAITSYFEFVLPFAGATTLRSAKNPMQYYSTIVICTIALNASAGAFAFAFDSAESGTFVGRTTSGPMDEYFVDPQFVQIGMLSTSEFQRRWGVMQFDVSSLHGGEVFSASLFLDAVSGSFDGGSVSFFGFHGAPGVSLADSDRQDISLSSVLSNFNVYVDATNLVKDAVADNSKTITIIGRQNQDGTNWNFLTKTGASNIYNDLSRGNNLTVQSSIPEQSSVWFLSGLLLSVFRRQRPNKARHSNPH